MILHCGKVEKPKRIGGLNGFVLCEVHPIVDVHAREEEREIIEKNHDIALIVEGPWMGIIKLKFQSSQKGKRKSEKLETFPSS